MPHGIIGLALTAIIGLFHYGFFGWPGFFMAIVVLIAAGVWAFLRFKGDYFVEADADGVRWRTNLLSKYKNIPWKYIQRIDYLEYEINFKLKETGQVVSFATSAITDEEAERLKETISNILTEREEGGLQN